MDIAPKYNVVRKNRLQSTANNMTPFKSSFKTYVTIVVFNVSSILSKTIKNVYEN